MKALRTQSKFVLERHERGPLRTAHGGASRLAPDNTLESIIAAANHPLDLVEVDLHLTRDGKLLLWHDEHFVTPDGVFEIKAHTLADLRALEVPDGTLATLEDAIETVRGKCGLMIDLKADQLEQPILDRLKKHDFSDVMVCGGYADTLKNIKLERPDLAVSCTPDPAFYRSMYAELGRMAHLDALTVYWRTVGGLMVDLARATGTLLLAWTVDHPHIARDLLERGVDGLTSNSLEVLLGLPRDPGQSSGQASGLS